MEKVLGLLNLHTDRDLGVLTEKRAIASTSFLGRYAFMDFPLSNFANSDIDEIGILVRDHLRSLIRHLGSGHAFNDNTKIGSITMLYDEPFAHNLGYNNDINNLAENRWMIDKSHAKTVVICPSSIIAKIDFRKYVEEHHRHDSKVSMIYSPIKNGRTHFIDSDILDIENNTVKSISTNRGMVDEINISLNTYIIDKEYLLGLMKYAADTSAFFSLRDVFAHIKDNVKITALPFEGYVTYFDSLTSYLSQSLELLDPKVCNQLFTPDWPIYTKTYDTPPAMYGKHAKVSHSFIANGAKINGTVKNSIIGRDVIVEKGANIENSIIFSYGKVGENCILKNVIADKEAQIIFSKHLEGTMKDPFFIKREDTV